MRAGLYTLVALDAVLSNPMRYEGSNTALLKLGGTGRQGSIERHLGNRNIIALQVHDGFHDILCKVIGIGRNQAGGLVALGNLRRNDNLVQSIACAVDCSPVLLDDILALLEEGLLDILLDQVNGLSLGKNLTDLEEGSLHNGIDAASKPGLLGNLESVDVVEADLLLDDLLLHLTGQVLKYFVGRNLAVEQKYTTLLERAEHVIATDVCGVVTSDEVGMVDQPRHLERALAEAQVTYCDTTTLLGVVGEISLCIEVGIVADDLDGVLVCTNGTVGAKTPEHAGHNILGGDVDGLVDGDGAIGDVIVDANGEVVESLACKVVIHSLGVAGGEVLAGQTEASADYLHVGSAHLAEGGNDILVEGLAEGTGFLGAVEYGDSLHRGGNCLYKVFCTERAIKAHLQNTGLSTLLVQVVTGPFKGIGTASHDNDNIGCIGIADIVKEVVGTAGKRGNLIHVLLHHLRKCFIIRVYGLTTLEVYVLVLGGDFQLRVLGAHGTLAEAADILFVYQRLEIFIGDLLDLLKLMGCPETIEEAEERNLCLECGQMGNQGQVHGLLNVVCTGHGKAGVAAGHDVGVISEN
ncbi:hypothetical protein DSECCO2_450910 [anaerobic digester metagenome]